MSIKDKLYGNRPTDPATRSGKASGEVALPGSTPLPKVGMASVAIGDASGTVSDDLLRMLHRRLIQTRERRPGDSLFEPENSIRKRLTDLLGSLPTDAEFAALPNLQGQLAVISALRDRFIDYVARDIMVLGPLGPLLGDPTVTDVMVNGPSAIFYEQAGTKTLARAFLDDLHLRAVVSRILETVGRVLDTRTPILDARLKDGTHMEIVQPPVSVEGLSLTFRKVPEIGLSLEDLVGRGTLSPRMAKFLELCVRGKINLVIAGGSSSGRSTMLNALAQVIPHEERVVVIEEVPQLRLSTPNRVHLQPVPSDGNAPEVALRDLLKTALRLRPSRIVLGECRGPEALDLILAMAAGQDGCMTTCHAVNPREAMTRLQTLSLLSGSGVSEAAVNRQIGISVQLVVQLERHADGVRRVTSITAVQGQSGSDVPLSFTDVFVYAAGGRGSAGAFRASGVVPHFQSRLGAPGEPPPSDLYSA